MNARWSKAFAIVMTVTAFWPIGVAAQRLETDAHSVRVSVLPISVVTLSPGTVTLDMSQGEIIPGQDEMSVEDQSTVLSWGTNSSSQKITAGTSLASSLFELRLVAVNPTRGSAGPEFTLSPAAQDLVLEVGRSTGSCVLRYTGRALASQGAGTDVHVITFTVVSQ